MCSPRGQHAGERSKGEEDFLQNVQEARGTQSDAVQEGQGLSLRARWVKPRLETPFRPLHFSQWIPS